MTNEQIKHMVARFLCWPLPDDFRPDNGISFEPTYAGPSGRTFPRDPVGTNLLDARQAEAMVRHMTAGLADTYLTRIYDILARISEQTEIGDDGYARFGSVNDYDRLRDLVRELEPGAIEFHASKTPTANVEGVKTDG